MKRVIETLIFSVFLMVFSINAYAQDNSEKIAEIEAEIKTLQEQLKDLKAEDRENVVIESNLNNLTLYDNEIKIDVTGIDADKGMSLYVENNSTLNLGVMTRAFAVNGYMIGENIGGINSFDVAPGKKANATEIIERDVLDKYDISSFDTLDALFWAYDNDKNFKEFDTGQIHAELTPGSENSFGISGETLYDNNGIKVDYISSSGKTSTYCLTNTSGEYINFTVENLTINDYTSSDLIFEIYDVLVLNNCQILFDITPGEEFLNSNGITDIYSIEFYLYINPLSDYRNDWNTDVISKLF